MIVIIIKKLNCKDNTITCIHSSYVNISGDSSLFLLLVPPPSVNFSSQPVVRGP